MKNLTNPRIIALVIFFCSLFALHAQTNTSLTVDRSLENAKVTFQDSILTVTTGKVTRQWRWIGSGFLTITGWGLKPNEINRLII